MAAVDDLTELVERAAAAERAALAAKWKDRADVETTIRRVRKAAEEQRAAVRLDQNPDRLSPRWAQLRQNYLDLGAQPPVAGEDDPAGVTHAAAARAEADAVAAVGVARIALTDAALAVLQARLARIDAGEEPPMPRRSTAMCRWPAATRSAGTAPPWPVAWSGRSATSSPASPGRR